MTRLFFAGAEAHWHRFVKWKVPYVMFSYFKNRRKGAKEPLSGVVECRKAGLTCVLDSGAHSIQVRPELGIDPYEYKEKYFKFLETYHSLFEWVVELDITRLVDKSEVVTWRKEMRDRGINNFIPVWHGDDRVKDWKGMLRNYDYVGTQTKLKKVSTRRLWQNLKLAARNNVKVHGFGMSDAKPICHYFDSLDSTSWQRAPRFGVLDWFSNGGGNKQSMTNVQLKRKGKKYERFNKIESDPLHGIGIVIWLKYVRYLESAGPGTKGLLR